MVAEEGDTLVPLPPDFVPEDWERWKEDDWQEKMQQTPLFMTSAPTTNEVDNNSTLAALQSLIYDGTPEGHFNRQCKLIV